MYSSVYYVLFPPAPPEDRRRSVCRRGAKIGNDYACLNERHHLLVSREILGIGRALWQHPRAVDSAEAVHIDAGEAGSAGERA